MNPLPSSGESLSHLSHRAFVPCVSGLQKAPYARLHVFPIPSQEPHRRPRVRCLYSPIFLSLPQPFLNRLLFHIRPTSGLQRGHPSPLSSTQALAAAGSPPSPLGVSYCISWLRAPTSPLSPESLLAPSSFFRPYPSRAAALCHRLLLRVSDLVLRVYLLLPPLLRCPSDTTLFCVFLFDLASTY